MRHSVNKNGIDWAERRERKTKGRETACFVQIFGRGAGVRFVRLLPEGVGQTMLNTAPHDGNRTVNNHNRKRNHSRRRNNNNNNNINKNTANARDWMWKYN